MRGEEPDNEQNSSFVSAVAMERCENRMHVKLDVVIFKTDLILEVKEMKITMCGRMCTSSKRWMLLLFQRDGETDPPPTDTIYYMRYWFLHV